jgi:hypothetical protein
MKYNQELPAEVESALDAYIERIKNIAWFKPKSSLTRDEVEVKANIALSAFGLSAPIEYRKLNTPEDWDAALSAERGVGWEAARDVAWGVGWGVARGVGWGVTDVLATFTGTYKKDAPFVKLIDLWEMGLYPCGVINGKFVVYVPEGTKIFSDTSKGDLSDYSTEELLAEIERRVK